MPGRGWWLCFGAAVLMGCAPRVRPLTGVPAPRWLPAASLPPGYRVVVFRWVLTDQDLEARGEGAARLAAPDSARVDFFLAGGAGSGAAVLVGDQLRLSHADRVTAALVPPAHLLWAALGRAVIPALPDTTVRVDGDTLRADIGYPVAWRLTFARDTLRRVERIENGRSVEFVVHLADGRVRYRDAVRRRQLELTITRSTAASRFDAAIWNFP